MGDPADHVSNSVDAMDQAPVMAAVLAGPRARLRIPARDGDAGARCDERVLERRGRGHGGAPVGLGQSQGVVGLKPQAVHGNLALKVVEVEGDAGATGARSAGDAFEVALDEGVVKASGGDGQLEARPRDGRAALELVEGDVHASVIELAQGGLDALALHQGGQVLL